MSPDITVSKRNLRKHEAEILSKEIALTPNIIGYTPNELMRLQNVLVIGDAANIIGALAYIDSKRFIDLKVMLIREKFRGKGYGARLFKAAVALLHDTDKPMYTVTKNPAVIHLLQGAGFVQVRFTQLPLPCILHQSKMIFSLHRIKEFVRKSIKFPREEKFSYWIKIP